MKLYRAFNGWFEDEMSVCLVIAESKERAIKIAYEKFKEKADKSEWLRNEPSYYDKLSVELICDDVSKEFASEVQE
jgi:hypothetical protein